MEAAIAQIAFLGPRRWRIASAAHRLRRAASRHATMTSGIELLFPAVRLDPALRGTRQRGARHSSLGASGYPPRGPGCVEKSYA